MKLVPYGDLFDQIFLQFIENLINKKDTYSQLENVEMPGVEYSSSGKGETNKASELRNFMRKILPYDKFAEGINSLNSKQREVFNVVHTWAKDYVKYDKRNVEPTHMFLSGSGSTGTSHLLKVIYNAISNTLFYRCKDPEKPRVLSLGPVGISAVYIGGTIIHSTLGIKPGIRLLGLNVKYKENLKNGLSEVKFLIIDELSVVSSDLWQDIDSLDMKVGGNIYDDS